MYIFVRSLQQTVFGPFSDFHMTLGQWLTLTAVSTAQHASVSIFKFIRWLIMSYLHCLTTISLEPDCATCAFTTSHGSFINKKYFWLLPAVKTSVLNSAFLIFHLRNYRYTFVWVPCHAFEKTCLTCSALKHKTERRLLQFPSDRKWHIRWKAVLIW